ncbi:hypothetical protein ASG35_24015 [Burkholderia sp. Leaf177]|nr:hypothetical protein ASG35_24015 [Burkholderia sp. Leaf177]
MGLLNGADVSRLFLGGMVLQSYVSKPRANTLRYKAGLLRENPPHFEITGQELVVAEAYEASDYSAWALS